MLLNAEAKTEKRQTELEGKSSDRTTGTLEAHAYREPLEGDVKRIRNSLSSWATRDLSLIFGVFGFFLFCFVLTPYLDHTVFH